MSQYDPRGRTLCFIEKDGTETLFEYLGSVEMGGEEYWIGMVLEDRMHGKLGAVKLLSSSEITGILDENSDESKAVLEIYRANFESKNKSRSILFYEDKVC